MTERLAAKLYHCIAFLFFSQFHPGDDFLLISIALLPRDAIQLLSPNFPTNKKKKEPSLYANHLLKDVDEIGSIAAPWGGLHAAVR